MSNKQLIIQTTQDLIGLKVRDIKIDNENFLAIDFKDNITIDLAIEEKTETICRPAWRLLIQNDDWTTDTCKEHLRSLDLCHYIIPDEPTFDCISLNNNTIDRFNSLLKDQLLKEIKILPSCSTTTFVFDHLELYARADIVFNDDPLLANWYLYTPDHKVLCVSYAKAWIVDELTGKKINE